MNEYNRRRPQDDLPYEQQMKHIIRHYRWLLDQNEKLAAYARKLEREIDKLMEKTAKQAMTNASEHERIIQVRRERDRLKAHIEWLYEKIRGYDPSFKPKNP